MTDETLCRLEIEDDGRGFDLESGLEQGGWGLNGMYERADTIGAELVIDRGPAGGTLVKVEVKLE